MDENDFVLKPGQPPLSSRYGEETVAFRLLLPASQREYLDKRAQELGISAAEYLRRLIKADSENQTG